MNRLFTALAVTLLLTGGALAQNNAPASSGTNSTTGSSNAAVNPNGNTGSSVNASGTIAMVPSSALEKGANSFTEGQAKTRIESAGFTQISDLHKDGAGIWRGKATKDGKTVDVGFDYKGNLSAQ